ncbi:MAG: FtsX-like permease family protein [Burkholderiales bacterium]
MNLPQISFAYLRAKPLATALNLLLLALGIATITVLMLATRQLEERMTRDARGIDLVAGAKGSPMQLVLSAVFHLDAPTGNIPLAEAQALARNPLVKRAIPVALGDSYRGFRIVGTSHDYPALYGARLAEGSLWAKPMEAVLGAQAARATGLRAGASFVAAHGVGASDGDDHDALPYRVTGILAPTGSVLDRVVLTSVESVWLVHEHFEPGDDPQKILDAMHEEEKELTALLIQYASPLAAALLPRQVNAGPLQAASPAYESARLFRMLGVGIEVLRAFGFVLVLTAGLSVFIALTNALEERRYDLAVMRMLGATRGKLMALLMLEGLTLAAAGAALGLALGHLLTEALGAALRAQQQVPVTGWSWAPEELWLLALALAVGAAAALIPAWRASRAEVAPVLAEG